jgi:LuxR family transcriptional regulator, maltose regulon positive regulatory protein
LAAPGIFPDKDRWRVGLIHTKMAPPRPPRGRIARSALLERMEATTGRRLTVVVAPAGFGKTTLLAEWCQSLRARGHQIAWVSLDDDDDDPQQLGAYLIATLSRGAEDTPGRAADLLREDPLTPMKVVQGVLLNEIAECGREVFLFVDEFERLNSRQSVALVSRLLRYAPSNLHLILGSRRQPNLALGALAVEEQLLTLDSGALRFTADDAQMFFAQAGGVRLDRPGIEMLNDAAEGWVTGLQFAALALQEGVDTTQLARDLAGNRFGIDGYLDGAVFSQLPRDILQFALRVSILDRMSVGACDAVMGAGAHSWEKLDWLERHNIFIRALDIDRCWFRFHALMTDALRRRAQQRLNEELPVLHRRASRWFASQDLWPEAVRHALAGGETEQAAEWAENCATFMIDRGDVPTLLGWFSKLPAALVKRSVRLRLAKAWAQTLSYHIREARNSLEALADELDAAAHGSHGSPASPRDAELRAEVMAVRASIAGLVDDTPLALDLSRQAEVFPSAPAWALRFAHAAKIFGLAYDRGRAEISQLRQPLQEAHSETEPLYSSVYRLSMLGLASLVEGRLQEAIGTFEFALTRAEAVVGRASAASALPAGFLAELYYECNDLSRAQRVLSGRTAIAMQTCPLGSLLRYCRGAARMYARYGDVESALVILEEAREVAADHQWLRLRAGCDAETVRLYLHAGRIDDAERLVIDLQASMPARHPSPLGSFIETWASCREVKARVALARGRYTEAVGLVQELRTHLSAAGMRFLEARASILLALAFERRGDTEAALKALDAALHYASAEPTINSFVDEGEPMLALLRKCQCDATRRGTAVRGQIKRLLATFAHGAATTVPAPPRPTAAATLSAREMEIISHVSRGLSNKEIARALRVAPETIKWHLKNIYDKLNVSSRIEAVQSGLRRASGNDMDF